MSKQQSSKSGFGGQHAVVIGASMAGLLASRVLSEHFEQVTVIERDHLPQEIQPRKGVPQGRHVHILLHKGASIMDKLFPDLFPALLQDGSYEKVEENTIKVDVGYATRVYRRPEHNNFDHNVLAVYSTPPAEKRAGVLAPIEENRWIVTMIGWICDYPPDDEAGFLAFARSLPQPDLYEAIQDA